MTCDAAFVFYGQEKEILLRRYASLANREFTINKSIEYGQRRSRDHHLYPGGGDINIIVADINIGAQSYWNAEATMPLTGKKALNENLHAAALEGIWIPGSTRPESSSARAGPTIRKTSTNCIRRCTLRKQSALAQKFDSIHSVERARRVGSIDDIISLAELRPYLVRKVEEGMQRFSPSRKQ
jgi:hypothetical protein